jgi:hypothetical protein
VLRPLNSDITEEIWNFLKKAPFFYDPEKLVVDHLQKRRSSKGYNHNLAGSDTIVKFSNREKQIFLTPV